MIDKTQIIPASKAELYQVHGNHIDAIMETKDFLMSHIRTVIQEAKLAKGATTEVIMEDPEPFVTKAASLSYGDEEFGFTVIIASDKEEKSNQVMTFFPYYCVKKMRVRVETVWVWDNLLKQQLGAVMVNLSSDSSPRITSRTKMRICLAMRLKSASALWGCV